MINKKFVTLLIVVSVLAAGVPVSTVSAQAPSPTCNGFEGWSIESESGDSVVNTGLRVSIEGTGTYTISDFDGLFNSADDIATVQAGSETFIPRSALEGARDSETTTDELKLNILSADRVSCGDEKAEGTDFSVGPETALVLLDTPSQIQEGESTTVTVSGWSTQSGIDIFIQENDPVFDDTYTTVRTPTSGEDGFFSARVTITPSEHAATGDTAEIFAFADGVNNLGGNYEVEIVETDQPPQASFEIETQHPTANERIDVDASASSDDNGIEEYRWDVTNDGSIDGTWDVPTGSVRASNTYGPQEIRLQVVDSSGQTDSVTKTVDVNHPPVATFDVTPRNPTVSIGGTTTVSVDASESTDDLNDDDGYIPDSNYKWTIRAPDGDIRGEVEGTAGPFDFRDLSSGTWEIELTVTDNHGGTDTTTRTITVSEEDTTDPVADAGSADTTSVGDGIDFDGSDSSDNVGVDSYEWDIDGDGDYEKSGPTVSHTFQTVGTQTVTLRVTDAAGNADTDTVQVTVEDTASPTADAGGDKTDSIGSEISFDGSGSSDNVGIESYEWDIDGDGNYEKSGQSITHTYQATGTQTVTLRITDTSGNTDTDTIEVTIEDNASPTATAGEDKTISVGETVSFDGSGSSDNVGVESYEWDVDGDGDYEKSGSSISHTFQDVGTQTVTLRVTDAAGNADTDTVQVTVGDTASPTADAGRDQTASIGSEISFDGSGSSDNVGIESYEWDVDGDGDYEKSGASVSHTFQTAGTNTVTLRVSDAEGNTDTDTVEVTVEDTTDPVADAGENRSASIGESVTLDGTESTDNVEIVSYEWDIDADGTFEKTGQSISHAFQTPGSKSVTLRVSDAAENTDTDTLEVTVEGESSIGEAIDSNDNNRIDSSEILQGIRYWRTNEAVPGTNGKTISNTEILELIRLWRTNSNIDGGL